MDREIRKFTTRNGHEIVVLTYVTGRELRDMQSAYLDSVKVRPQLEASAKGVTEGKESVVEMGGAGKYMHADEKRIEICVKSVDGMTENVVDTVLDLRREDYEDVMVAVDELTVKKNDTAK
jgi:hypothetical protein